MAAAHHEHMPGAEERLRTDVPGQLPVNVKAEGEVGRALPEMLERAADRRADREAELRSLLADALEDRAEEHHCGVVDHLEDEGALDLLGSVMLLDFERLHGLERMLDARPELLHAGGRHD